MQQGSRMRADYDVTWDRDGFFRNGRSRAEQGKRWTPTAGAGSYKSEGSGWQSQGSRLSPEDARRKRFRVKTHKLWPSRQRGHKNFHFDILLLLNIADYILILITIFNLCSLELQD